MTLKDLIDSDPANSSRTDQQVLAWLTAEVNTWVDVSWLDLSMWIGGNDLRPTLVNKISSGTNAEKTAAQHLIDCLVAGQPLSSSDSRVRAVIAKAIPDSPVRDELLSMATASVQRWTLSAPITLNGRNLPDGPGLSHVTEARA